MKSNSKSVTFESLGFASSNRQEFMDVDLEDKSPQEITRALPQLDHFKHHQRFIQRVATPVPPAGKIISKIELKMDQSSML